MAGSFKTLPLLSSERSPDDWAERAGDKREAGETARLIAVPALYDDRTTVYDMMPAMPLRSREPWIRTQMSRCRDGLPHQRGLASQAYLDALTADHSTYVENATEDAAAFRAALDKHATTPIARDIIAKFAVLYAGGRAALDAKVLCFNVETIWRAVRRACVAAIECLPDAKADLHKDLVTLKSLLEGVGVIDADDASVKQKRNMDQVDGYFEKAAPGHKYVIRSATLMASFPSLLRARRVVEWLDDNGFLRHQRDRKLGVSTEWAQTHLTWPSGQRVRSFVLYFPGDLDVLDYS